MINRTNVTYQQLIIIEFNVAIDLGTFFKKIITFEKKHN